jgi:hypothetical protein
MTDTHLVIMDGSLPPLSSPRFVADLVLNYDSELKSSPMSPPSNLNHCEYSAGPLLANSIPDLQLVDL